MPPGSIWWVLDRDVLDFAQLCANAFDLFGGSPLLLFGSFKQGDCVGEIANHVAQAGLDTINMFKGRFERGTSVLLRAVGSVGLRAKIAALRCSHRSGCWHDLFTFLRRVIR